MQHVFEIIYEIRADFQSSHPIYRISFPRDISLLNHDVVAELNQPRGPWTTAIIVFEAREETNKHGPPKLLIDVSLQVKSNYKYYGRDFEIEDALEAARIVEYQEEEGSPRI